MVVVKVRKCDWPECQVMEPGLTSYRIAADGGVAVVVDLCSLHEREPLNAIVGGRSRKRPGTASDRIRQARETLAASTPEPANAKKRPTRES